MSNYTQVTFFTPKDTLPITDPNKTIFGAAYDVEFANISSAFTTKLDATFVNPSLVNLNVTANGIPVNGIYLPAANTLGFAVNTAFAASIAPTGSIWGAATGGLQGAGTINAQGLFVNGSAVLTSAGAGNTVVGTGAATLAAGGIAIGQTYIVYRSALLNRISTAVTAIDPVLQFTGLPVGTYTFDTYMAFNSASSAAGYRWSIFASSGSSSMDCSLQSQTGTTQVLISVATATPLTTSGQLLQDGTATTVYTFTGRGQITVATTSTIGIAWAQNTSTAVNTAIAAGAYFRITRLG